MKPTGELLKLGEEVIDPLVVSKAVYEHIKTTDYLMEMMMYWAALKRPQHNTICFKMSYGIDYQQWQCISLTDVRLALENPPDVLRESPVYQEWQELWENLDA